MGDELQDQSCCPVITLFLTGYTTTGAFSSLNKLIIDINIESPATAAAREQFDPMPFWSRCCNHFCATHRYNWDGVGLYHRSRHLVSN
jgi:hypothetical protein